MSCFSRRRWFFYHGPDGRWGLSDVTDGSYSGSGSEWIFLMQQMVPTAVWMVNEVFTR